MRTMIIIDRISEFYFISFSDSLNKQKRNPLRVIFQLFCDSQKLKILSSTCHFELIKENELKLSQYKFTHFSGWDWLFTKKVHLGRHGQEVLSDIVFYCFRLERKITKRGMMDFFFFFFFLKLSKHEKDTDFVLRRTRKKLNDKILVTMMIPSLSFLGLVKLTRIDSFEEWTYTTSIWYPLQACIKIKRYSLEIVGKSESETSLV